MSINEGKYVRTKKTLRNSAVALTLQILSIFIGFFSRKIFIDYLGTELLGLNTTASSILGFLNLAELGIGSAVAMTLYKPLFEKDEKSISEIVALQGWVYKKIAMVVLGGAVILMAFFPLIFSKSDLPLWCAYASFGTLLVSSMLGYFFNYKMIVLSADQNDYQIQLNVRTTGIVKLVLQAFAVRFFPCPFIWWLVLEVISAIVSAVLLRRQVNKTYPFLRIDVSNPRALIDKYPDIVTKVKQIFVHSIGGFVLSRVSPIIIYAYASLSLVALYGNYTILTTNLTFLFAALMSSATSSIGSMVVENDRKLIEKVFRESFASRFMMVTVCCICMWFLTQPFIGIWLGSQYLLPDSTLIILIVIFFLGIVRGTVDSFLYAYGMCRDIWSPICESIVFIGSSILLGRFYGLNGVLMGSVISSVLFIQIWKPYFLFHFGFKVSIMKYIWIYAKQVFAALVTFFVTAFCVKKFNLGNPDTIGEFLISGAVLLGISTAVMTLLSSIVEVGMRNFLHRMKIIFYQLVQKQS